MRGWRNRSKGQSISWPRPSEISFQHKPTIRTVSGPFRFSEPNTRVQRFHSTLPDTTSPCPELHRPGADSPQLNHISSAHPRLQPSALVSHAPCGLELPANASASNADAPTGPSSGGGNLLHADPGAVCPSTQSLQLPRLSFASPPDRRLAASTVPA